MLQPQATVKLEKFGFENRRDDRPWYAQGSGLNRRYEERIGDWALPRHQHSSYEPAVFRGQYTDPFAGVDPWYPMHAFEHEPLHRLPEYPQLRQYNRPVERPRYTTAQPAFRHEAPEPEPDDADEWGVSYAGGADSDDDDDEIGDYVAEQLDEHIEK